MKYLGGKSRLAKRIIPFIEAELNKSEFVGYCEPFLGAGSVFLGINTEKLRRGSDCCAPLIALWKHAQTVAVFPTEVSESEYQAARSGACLPWQQAFIGFGCSFGGKWFGGYARGKTARGDSRNYADECARSWVRAAALIKNSDVFACGSYETLVFAGRTVIYCDPPYAGTTGYDAAGNWDAPKFWTWAHTVASSGHAVFVSEYSCPIDAECLLEHTVKTSIPKNASDTYTRTERLFRVK